MTELRLRAREERSWLVAAYERTGLLEEAAELEATGCVDGEPVDEYVLQDLAEGVAVFEHDPITARLPR